MIIETTLGEVVYHSPIYDYFLAVDNFLYFWDWEVLRQIVDKPSLNVAFIHWFGDFSAENTISFGLRKPLWHFKNEGG